MADNNDDQKPNNDSVLEKQAQDNFEQALERSKRPVEPGNATAMGVAAKKSGMNSTPDMTPFSKSEAPAQEPVEDIPIEHQVDLERTDGDEADDNTADYELTAAYLDGSFAPGILGEQNKQSHSPNLSSFEDADPDGPAPDKPLATSGTFVSSRSDKPLKDNEPVDESDLQMLQIKAVSSADRKSEPEDSEKNETQNNFRDHQNASNDDIYLAEHLKKIENLRADTEEFGGFKARFLAELITQHYETTYKESVETSEHPKNDIVFSDDKNEQSLNETIENYGMSESKFQKWLSDTLNNTTSYEFVDVSKKKNPKQLLQTELSEVDEPHEKGFNVTIERVNSARSESVAPHLKALAISMLSTGLDEFELSGNDKLQTDFAAALAEAAKELDIENYKVKHPDAQPERSNKEEDDINNEQDRNHEHKADIEPTPPGMSP